MGVELESAEALTFNADGKRTTAATLTIALSGTNTVYTLPVDVRHYGAWSAQFVWVNGVALDGVLKAEFSLDEVTWTDSGITFAPIAGASGSRLIDATKSGVAYFRFKYTNIGGTATASAKFYGKEA